MNSRIAKSKNSITQRPVSFLAPGQLAKDRGYAIKTSNVAYGSKRIAIEEEKTNGLRNHETTGVRNIVLHFGEVIWKERNITDESSFLDLLAMCKRFIDIYSVGFKITDVDGRPLRNDKDFLGMLKEHEGVENILVYLDVDETLQPLLFKLPEDNPSSVSVPRDSQTREVIVEDSNGIETVHHNAERDSQTREVIVEDSNGIETVHHNAEKNVEDSTTKRVRKVRGRNNNKKVATLKRGEKLEIHFHNNRAVGPNHTYWSRHLGRIVRNTHICPIRVQTWKEMTEIDKKHMWAAVKDKFSNSDMELYREHTLEHMDTLWTAWKSDLKKKFVNPFKTKALMLKNVPPMMNANDWEWLVTKKFLSDEFKKISSRNSDNRAKQVMPHRTGSEPHRQIIYEMESTTNTTPSIEQIFLATRQKNGKFVEPREQEKYDEIVKTTQADASLSAIGVVETCFGPQNHSHVFGFGGGMKRKHFNDPQAAQIKELKGKLHEKEEENNAIKRRFEEIENRLTQMENGNQPTSDKPPVCGDDLN